jgi:ankyrin repeat protein
VNKIDKDGWSPLLFAADTDGDRKVEIVSLLVANGANVAVRAGSFITPLVAACLSPNGQSETVRVLLKAGANVNQQANGLSPLHCASRQGLEACLMTLLHYGADLDHRSTPNIHFGNDLISKEGQSPLEVAVANGHAGCASILRKWPALNNQLAAKLCLERMRREGMHAVVEATPTNDLSRPMFVFKVLDMMMNCMMHPLGEGIMEYVGTNVGLKVEKKIYIFTSLRRP